MHSRTDKTDASPASAASFTVSRQALDERTSVISVEGELDLVTAPQLKWALLDSTQAGHSQLVVDLSRTTFMDSTALGVLIGVKRGLGTDGRLTLVCDAPRDPEGVRIGARRHDARRSRTLPTVDSHGFCLGLLARLPRQCSMTA